MTERRHGLTRPSEDDIRKGGFSTPWDAPMVPPFPFKFRNAEILTVFYRSDPEMMRFLAPPPLVPTGDVVAIHIYKMNDTDWLGPYAEANVMFGAELPGRARGAYSTNLLLKSDVGVAHGRETHGQPKKYANPELQFRGDLIVATVERNGIDIITATLPYKQRQAIPARSRSISISPPISISRRSTISTARPAIRQLTSRKLAEVKVHECWRGPCTVELRPNAQAPVHRLPVMEPLEGFFWRADFTLVPGEIIYDYLSEGDA